MDKYLRISSGPDGWGGPLYIKVEGDKKIAYITGGVKPAVVNHLERLTGWPSIDMFKHKEPPINEIALVVIDCGGTLRCGVYPKQGIPTLNLYSTGKSGPLAEYITADRYVSAVQTNSIELVDSEGNSQLLGIVSDDITGATTVGTLLAHAGMSCAAFFDKQGLISSPRRYQAMVVSSDSRALPKEQAQREVTAATQALWEKGARYFSKRIDTTLRGGIGYEIDAMLDFLGDEAIAVVVPAMPQSRRILVGGYSVIDCVALSQTDVAHDVRTPVVESHIPHLLAAQTQHQVGYVSLSDVLDGFQATCAAFLRQRDAGARVIVADAISEDHIQQLAEAVVRMNWSVLAVDPGPFTEQLAMARGLIRESSHIDTSKRPAAIRQGALLAVAGSATPVTQKQLKYLIKHDNHVCHIPVDAELLIDKENAADIEISRVYQRALSCLRQQPNSVCVLESALTGRVLDLAQTEQRFNLKHGEAAANINQGLGLIARQILESDSADVIGLYLTGGDTMINVLRQLGAAGIEMIDYVIPQTDMVRIIGGQHEGLLCVGKGGLTGYEEVVGTIINRIYQEHNATSTMTEVPTAVAALHQG